MKNLKKFSDLNEKLREPEIDFRFFIDYVQFNKKDFLKSLKDTDANLDTDNVFRQLKNIWDQSKLEKTIHTKDNNIFSLLPGFKPKYPYVYLFFEDIGDPCLYVVSSELKNLSQLISDPENL